MRDNPKHQGIGDFITAQARDPSFVVASCMPILILAKKTLYCTIFNNSSIRNAGWRAEHSRRMCTKKRAKMVKSYGWYSRVKPGSLEHARKQIPKPPRIGRFPRQKLHWSEGDF